jgi:hypothetical protein
LSSAGGAGSVVSDGTISSSAISAAGASVVTSLLPGPEQPANVVRSTIEITTHIHASLFPLTFFLLKMVDY